MLCAEVDVGHNEDLVELQNDEPGAALVALSAEFVSYFPDLGHVLKYRLGPVGVLERPAQRIEEATHERDKPTPEPSASHRQCPLSTRQLLATTQRFKITASPVFLLILCHSAT